MLNHEGFKALLALVRLGDVDRKGWWRSRSCDDTAEYVLGEAFPSTWLATGLELAMESARVRHEQALAERVGGATAVHVFSDHLPFHQLLRNWLIERKLERDPEPLQWLRQASTEDLISHLGQGSDGERRAEGLYLGTVSPSEINDEDGQRALMERLTGAYRGLNEDFLAPYVDLSA